MLALRAARRPGRLIGRRSLSSSSDLPSEADVVRLLIPARLARLEPLRAVLASCDSDR